MAPRYVGRHAVELQFSPDLLVMERFTGPAQRAGESFVRAWTKHKASRRATADAVLFNVIYCIREAADPRYDRDRAESQGAELGQAAGLETRRHDEGIGTGLNKMGEGFIIANKNRYPALIRFRGRLIAILETVSYTH